MAIAAGRKQPAGRLDMIATGGKNMRGKAYFDMLVNMYGRKKAAAMAADYIRMNAELFIADPEEITFCNELLYAINNKQEEKEHVYQ